MIVRGAFNQLLRPGLRQDWEDAIKNCPVEDLKSIFKDPPPFATPEWDRTWRNIQADRKAREQCTSSKSPSFLSRLLSRLRSFFTSKEKERDGWRG